MGFDTKEQIIVSTKSGVRNPRLIGVWPSHLTVDYETHLTAVYAIFYKNRFKYIRAISLLLAMARLMKLLSLLVFFLTKAQNS